MNSKIILVLISFTVSFSAAFAQFFSEDSLKGFDENSVRTRLISQDFLGQELKYKLFVSKREYINSKYNLVQKQTYYPQPQSKQTVFAGCNNEDFEASSPGVVTNSTQIAGWIINSGYNGSLSSSSTNTIVQYFPGGLTGANSCNLLGCCPAPPGNSEIIDCSAPSGYIDNNIGTHYPIFSVFGTGTVSGAAATNSHIAGGLYGNKVLRINDPITGDYSIEKLSKTFLVTAANSFFQMAFISVFSPGHGCCDAGGLQMNLTNITTNSIIPCSSFSVSAPSSQCTATVFIPYLISLSGAPYTSTSSANSIYNRWKLISFDLSPYVGQTINLNVIVTDCSAGGHFGLLYFDSQCGALKVNINNTDFIAADSVVNFKSCDTIAKLKAPANFASYQWKGPSGFTSVNPALTTTVNGIYTLTLNNSDLCAPITKTINIQLEQNTMHIVSPESIICAGELLVLSVTGTNNGVWSTGSTALSINVSPTVTSTYSFTAISPLGCLITASYTQLVEECVGLNAQNYFNKAISIFPNPNNGEFALKIEMKLDKAMLSIESSLGQSVHKQAVQQGSNAIKTKGLASGVYYFTLSEKEKTIYKGKLQIE
ncbi:T9SS type A sorting domain-containing protein [Aurantibacillus circumpalustris]|uniref:T9SS type A sorting domain-containing protein n=1 Tax=Aurantibacillus circumpalustris TaxID=3036359 RepID=UPI00295A7FE0|nr:T9SS type A sorting domain-containing protein [Aurantibacillus circumpalustris]